MAANTPNIDSYKAKYPWTLVDAAGSPWACRTDFKGPVKWPPESGCRADRAAGNKAYRRRPGRRSLLKQPKWKELSDTWRSNQSTLHLLGLLQDEGVHAYQEHLFKIMKRAREEYPEGRIVVHPIP